MALSPEDHEHIRDIFRDVHREETGSITPHAPPSVKKDWARSIISAIAIGGALATLGFFLFKSDAEATDERTEANGVHTALEVKDKAQDVDRKRIEKDHRERFDEVKQMQQHIIRNQVLQSLGKRAKPNGD